MVEEDSAEDEEVDVVALEDEEAEVVVLEAVEDVVALEEAVAELQMDAEDLGMCHQCIDTFILLCSFLKPCLITLPLPLSGQDICFLYLANV